MRSLVGLALVVILVTFSVLFALFSVDCVLHISRETQHILLASFKCNLPCFLVIRTVIRFLFMCSSIELVVQ